jgi:2-oxo-4-hydroxy-4-carboxy-5-ureidoimidazoline decarboxylase
VTIDQLNAMDREPFVASVGGVFEHSPWVAERVWPARPFDDLRSLHLAMSEQVALATRAEQIELIRAHPDLGTRARMTDASTSEQAGAGLDRLSSAEFHRLQTLNAAYREKFGFPFIYAVKGSTKQGILKALESRLSGDYELERQIALEQICKIARFRLEEMFSCVNS